LAITRVQTSQTAYTIKTISSTTYAATEADSVLLVNAASDNIAISLPQASTVLGKRFDIKKIDSSAHTVTITTYGAETIDGSTTQLLANQYTSLTFVTDGSNWYII
jgi:hypothetical protein